MPDRSVQLSSHPQRQNSGFAGLPEGHRSSRYSARDMNTQPLFDARRGEHFSRTFFRFGSSSTGASQPALSPCSMRVSFASAVETSSADFRSAMIRHHRKPENVNPEDPREKLQPIPNPFAAMFVIVSRQFISPAEKSSPHTPIHAVNHLNLTIRQNFSPIDACHE